MPILIPTGAPAGAGTPKTFLFPFHGSVDAAAQIGTSNLQGSVDAGAKLGTSNLQGSIDAVSGSAALAVADIISQVNDQAR